MLAVLDDAIECFQKYAGARARKRGRLFLEAEQWILERDGAWPFSFENICDVLNLDPSYIRRGLMQQQQLLSGSPSERFRFKSRTRINRAIRITTPRAAKGLTIAAGIDTKYNEACHF